MPRQRRVLVAAALAGLLFCAAAVAADAPDDLRPIPAPAAARPARGGQKPAAGARSEKKPAGGMWTTLAALTAVLALVYLTAKVLRKNMPAAQRPLPAEVMQVLGRKPLDYKHTIHLVRCGSRLLVLGSSQAGLTALSEISDPVEVDYLAGLCKPGEAGSVADSFQQLFRRFQGSPRDDDDADDSLDADPAVLRLQARLQQPPHDEATAAHDVSSGEAAG